MGFAVAADTAAMVVDHWIPLMVAAWAGAGGTLIYLVRDSWAQIHWEVPLQRLPPSPATSPRHSLVFLHYAFTRVAYAESKQRQGRLCLALTPLSQALPSRPPHTLRPSPLRRLHVRDLTERRRRRCLRCLLLFAAAAEGSQISSGAFEGLGAFGRGFMRSLKGVYGYAHEALSPNLYLFWMEKDVPGDVMPQSLSRLLSSPLNPLYVAGGIPRQKPFW